MNHVWCYDFVSEQTLDGRTLKFLTVEDEYTRECLAIEVARSLTSVEVIETLQYLFDIRGVPEEKPDHLGIGAVEGDYLVHQHRRAVAIPGVDADALREERIERGIVLPPHGLDHGFEQHNGIVSRSRLATTILRILTGWRRPYGMQAPR